MTHDITKLRSDAKAIRALLPNHVPQTQIEFLIDYIDNLRQALWDCYALAGSDTDGMTTPLSENAIQPDVQTLARRAVQELRDDYDEALREMPWPPAAVPA